MDCEFDCEEFRRYRVNLPYPEVEIREKDRRYACLISGAYGGRGSEMTAITQYWFHRLYAGAYPDVFTALGYISMVETKHLSLLGGLIRRLGLVPVYASFEDCSYWNGSFPNSDTEIGKMLAADLEGERGAVAHYKRLIGQIDHESMRTLFRRIILDEERHIEVLTLLSERYG